MKTTVIIRISCLLAALCSTVNAYSEKVYMFSYFRGNGETGLHLAYSIDGLEWTPLNNGRPLLRPEIGGKLMRDPSIVQGPDGQFHMVWTTGWWDQTIGLAHSKDLVNWSEQRLLQVMSHEPTARNSWAPEIFYDDATEQYLIYWATTIPGRYPETDKEENPGSGILNHRQYYISTKDFKTFSDPKLFYDDGFSVIDGFIIKHDGKYVMIVKDETRHPVAKKDLRITVSDRAEGPYGPASEPFTKVGWVEGPAALKVGEWIYVYYDMYTAGRYGAMRTKDFKTWEDVSDRLKMPGGVRHGTTFETNTSVLLNF